MTYGQKLRKEAKIEGKIEGLQEGIFQVAKSMLQDKEPIDKIARWTGLSQEEIDRLQPMGI
jgi:predicted transposase/invertase (TIGR01784 family)